MPSKVATRRASAAAPRPPVAAEPSAGELRVSEARFRLLVESIRDYAIFLLDAEGHIATWNAGAERIKGFRANDVLGQHFRILYPAEDAARGKPEDELRRAVAEGRVEDEGYRVRKDGSTFWANVVIGALYDEAGRLLGFTKVTRDMTERRRTEVALQKAKEAAEAANRELEAFSYSVSHDLRTPLRTIDGFCLALAEDYADKLDSEGRDYLVRVRAAAQRMSCLIDNLLELSRVGRTELKREDVDLSALAVEVAGELQAAEPGRQVAWLIQEGLSVRADPRLLRVVLENLLGNAWKFTAKRADVRIELGATSQKDETVYFVRDNGAGFDMAYAGSLFGAFQRLHNAGPFPGEGIGLATVQRIVHRHGGRIRAEGALDRGATFSFTLPAEGRHGVTG